MVRGDCPSGTGGSTICILNIVHLHPAGSPCPEPDNPAASGQDDQCPRTGGLPGNSAGRGDRSRDEPTRPPRRSSGSPASISCEMPEPREYAFLGMGEGAWSSPPAAQDRISRRGEGCACRGPAAVTHGIPAQATRCTWLRRRAGGKRVWQTFQRKERVTLRRIGHPAMHAARGPMPAFARSAGIFPTEPSFLVPSRNPCIRRASGGANHFSQHFCP